MVYTVAAASASLSELIGAKLSFGKIDIASGNHLILALSKEEFKNLIKYPPRKHCHHCFSDPENHLDLETLLVCAAGRVAARSLEKRAQ